MPALVMGAASANVPAVALVTGPMLTEAWTASAWRRAATAGVSWGRFRRGEIDADRHRRVGVAAWPADGGQPAA